MGEEPCCHVCLSSHTPGCSEAGRVVSLQVPDGLAGRGTLAGKSHPGKLRKEPEGLWLSFWVGNLLMIQMSSCAAALLCGEVLGRRGCPVCGTRCPLVHRCYSCVAASPAVRRMALAHSPSLRVLPAADRQNAEGFSLPVAGPAPAFAARS